VERQTMVSTGMKDQDIIGLSYHSNVAGIVMLLVRSGYMVGSKKLYHSLQMGKSR